MCEGYSAHQWIAYGKTDNVTFDVRQSIFRYNSLKTVISIHTIILRAARFSQMV